MKFTAYEAEGIQALVATSPLMSWMYKVFSLQATSNIIGVAEITAAVLIAIRPISAKLSAIGSVLAVFTFLATLTFSVLFARLGEESGWLSSPLGLWRISVERCGVTQRFALDPG